MHRGSDEATTCILPRAQLRVAPAAERSTPALAAAAASSLAGITAPAALGSSRPAASNCTPSSASMLRFLFTLAVSMPQEPLKPPSWSEAAITRWQGTVGA